MIRTMVYHRKKIWVVFLICIMLLLGLVGRLWYLMNVRAEYYSKKAEDLHERERDIKAARGKILDIRGNILADNRTVCTVSVIHSQIKDPEKVIRVLSGALSVKEEEIRKKVEKISSIERIQTNVEKSIGDRIRQRLVITRELLRGGDIILMDLSLQKYWDLPEVIIRGSLVLK